MKVYKYKFLSILLLLAIGLQAQTFDKKEKESFKVNSDVELVINTTHSDVTIETWNKNEISVEAVMEVEGVSKEEADKILSKWKFEALGNKNTVKITSVSSNMDFNFDFDFDFSDMDIVIPEFEMQDIHIDIPDIEFPEMPEIPEMEEIDFDYEAYKNDSTYLKQYKMQVAEQVNKFKNSDWKHKMDSVKNSDEFKQAMEEVKRAAIEAKKEMLENKKLWKEQAVIAKKAALEAREEMLENKELWQEQAEMAKEASKMAMDLIEEMKENGTFDSIHNFSENIYFNYGTSNNSKIKIKKHIKIKVPKGATFDLNVRHGKLNVPSSTKKMSANISYGDFIGGIIIGDENDLNFSNSPVTIKSLDSGNITLKNVPNATFGTFSNGNLFSNSSDVIIDEIGENVDLIQKFGSLEISNIVTNFKTFNLILDYSKASINLSKSNYIFQISDKKSTLKLNESLTKVSNNNLDGVKSIEGFYKDKNSINKLFLTSVYSSLILN